MARLAGIPTMSLPSSFAASVVAPRRTPVSGLLLDDDVDIYASQRMLWGDLVASSRELPTFALSSLTFASGETMTVDTSGKTEFPSWRKLAMAAFPGMRAMNAREREIFRELKRRRSRKL